MTQPQIQIHHLYYALPDGKPLFRNITLAISTRKTGVVGRNGTGKSTLLKLILGQMAPDNGSILVEGSTVCMPQNYLIEPTETVATFLGHAEKIGALQRIRAGSVAASDYEQLNNDWDIETRIHKALTLFNLQHLPLDRLLTQVSGGELSRLALASVFSSRADFILLDEPSNHLDKSGRQQLINALRQWENGLMIVSHDRALLNEMEEIIEITPVRIASYGGNYEDYQTQKAIETAALDLKWHDAKKSLRLTNSSIQSTREKHEKKQSYGKELKKSGSIDKLSANSKRGRSERTQSKLLIKSERMMKQAVSDLKIARSNIDIFEAIHVDLPATTVPNGKVILDINKLTFSFSNNTKPLIQDFDLTLQGPERIAIQGDNGTGKSTLVKLILSAHQPVSGSIYLGTSYISYLDQTLALLQPDASILDNFMRLNPEATQNDAHRALAAFLFRNHLAYQVVSSLSGGEKLRAALACVLNSKHPPQLLILDEPTNHLDLHSIQCIESALRNYLGAMLVISHDEAFLRNVGVTKSIITPLIKRLCYN